MPRISKLSMVYEYNRFFTPSCSLYALRICRGHVLAHPRVSPNIRIWSGHKNRNISKDLIYCKSQTTEGKYPPHCRENPRRCFQEIKWHSSLGSSGPVVFIARVCWALANRENRILKGSKQKDVISAGYGEIYGLGILQSEDSLGRLYFRNK